MKSTSTINLILFGLCFLIAITGNAQEDWVLKSPATNPTTFQTAAMAYIGGDKVLFFGGQLGANGSDETWVYDLSDNSWTLEYPTSAPSPRFYHAMSNIGDDKVLLYGGEYDGSGVFLEDTWVYDLSDHNWTQKNPTTVPPARYGHAMASLGGDQVLLFGGYGGTNTDDVTWVYDLSEDNWTSKNPGTKPSVLFGLSMATIGESKVILFGGLNPDFIVEDKTWVYDLNENNWTLKSPAISPSNRLFHTMANFTGDKVLLFGGEGEDLSTINGETWMYDLSDNNWTQKSPATNPGDQFVHEMAKIGDHQVLMFASYNTTWLYTLVNPPCSISVSAGADEHLYFGYGPAQCKTKTVTITGGTSPFTYSWTLNRALLSDVITSSGDETMTGNTTSTVTVCLLDTAQLCVTVTDINGCTASDCAEMFAEDVRCFSGNNQKVNVCHNGNTICVDENALSAHLNHGDYLGTCTSIIAEHGDVGFGDHSKPGLIIYPNPCDGNFNVSLDITDNGISSGSIQIINLSGQVLKQININKQNRFNIYLEESGVYFVQLITKEQLISQKLVVLH